MKDKVNMDIITPLPIQATEFAMVINTQKIYSDQTGRFPIQSSRGNNYIFLLYSSELNYIFARPLKNRLEQSITNAYIEVYAILVKCGYKPLLHWMDNEAPKMLLAFNKENNVTVQLMPPYTHRCNTAEREILTFKNHLIAGMVSLPNDFPMHLWDRLMEQAEWTLNMLRPFPRNNKLSAYEAVHGTYDFVHTPMAPPGTKVVIHENPSKRKTWAPHGLPGWYIGPALQHHKCWRIFVTATASERISNTVHFFHHQQPPPLTPEQEVLHAVSDLKNAIMHPGLTFPKSYTLLQAIKQLQKIFETPHNTVTQRVVQTNNDIDDANTKQRVEQDDRHREQRVVRTSPRKQLQPSSSLTGNATNIPTPYNLRSNPIGPFHQLNGIINKSSGKVLEYKHLIMDPTTKMVWEQSFARELGRLSQGYRSTEGTNTIEFIDRAAIPYDKRSQTTYGKIVVDYRTGKKDVHRTRLTVGGNLIDYPGCVTTPTADLELIKMHFNSVISTPNARFATFDISNFFLDTEMEKAEYMFLPYTLIPEEIIQQYKLHSKTYNGRVYIKIQRGMYGLKQSGMLAHKKLVKILHPHGYHPCANTPGLWRHRIFPITFTLIVDDFGVKYQEQKHALHLLQCLQANYSAVVADWSGEKYAGITLDWNYTNKRVDLSMPNYINTLLAKYQHTPSTKQQHAPHKWISPSYGQKTQKPFPIDRSTPLHPTKTKRIQQILGSLLFYARAIDSTLLVAINTIASTQAKPTIMTENAVQHLLDYCYTHPNAKLQFHATDMILKLHSDASYLSEANARSRVAGYFYLGNLPPRKLDCNGAIHINATIIKHVVTSAAEAEYAALFLNAKLLIPLRQALTDMGHKQPATPVCTDNSTEYGIASCTCKQKFSKSMDMRYHWLRDKLQQNFLDFFWKPGSDNLGDYFSKHHPPSHHKHMRKTYLVNLINTLIHTYERVC